MNEYRLADLRYCPAVGGNVIMQKVWRKGEVHLECLSKDECDFKHNGCKNALMPHIELKDTRLGQSV